MRTIIVMMTAEEWTPWRTILEAKSPGYANHTIIRRYDPITPNGSHWRDQTPQELLHGVVNGKTILVKDKVAYGELASGFIDNMIRKGAHFKYVADWFRQEGYIDDPKTDHAIVSEAVDGAIVDKKLDELYKANVALQKRVEVLESLARTTAVKVKVDVPAEPAEAFQTLLQRHQSDFRRWLNSNVLTDYGKGSRDSRGYFFRDLVLTLRNLGYKVNIEDPGDAADVTVTR